MYILISNLFKLSSVSLDFSCSKLRMTLILGCACGCFAALSGSGHDAAASGVVDLTIPH